MPNLTKNYGLKKPLSNEFYDINVHNDNMDIIDEELKKKFDSNNLPTVDQIGAAPANHGNHVPAVQSADNSKFLRNDNTWQNVTPENIGAAPNGYGLGASSIQIAYDDLDNVTANGWYYFEKTTTIAGVDATYWCMRVFNYGSGTQTCTQEIYPISLGVHCRIIRRKHAGTWQEPEVDNPPLKLGKEYRTTERVNDKPVYKKYMSLGYTTSGESTFEHGINIDVAVDIKIYNGGSENITNNKDMESLYFNRTIIKFNRSNHTANAIVLLSYTKN